MHHSSRENFVDILYFHTNQLTNYLMAILVCRDYLGYIYSLEADGSCYSCLLCTLYLTRFPSQAKNQESGTEERYKLQL